MKNSVKVIGRRGGREGMKERKQKGREGKGKERKGWEGERVFIV